jgi:YihY family inner membrane protein
MSTASHVPEGSTRDGADAREILKRTGRGRLLRDSFVRFRAADGFTHVRALAHAAVLTAFPALITVIGVATAFDLATMRQVLEDTLQSLAPGPAGELLREAFRQGSRAAGTAALIAGLVSVLVAGTFVMMQVERGCNRVYGLVRDRKTARKVGVAFLLNVSAGMLLTVAFILLAAGSALGDAISESVGWGDTSATVFSVLRWPAGLLLVFLGLTLVFRVSPDRRQPGAAWLQTGTIMATILWFAFTSLLALYYGTSEQIGETYGPLLGIVALLTWAYATALALFLGIAFAAQLEAVRAGVPGPRVERRENTYEGSARPTTAMPSPTDTTGSAARAP